MLKYRLRSEIGFTAERYAALLAEYRFAVKARHAIIGSGPLELGSSTTGEMRSPPYIELSREIVRIDRRIRGEAGCDALRLVRKLVIDGSDRFAMLCEDDPAEPLV